LHEALAVIRAETLECPCIRSLL